ncbi:MAG: diaminopimelate decarboxylase [Nitrospirae bacterium]|nr:diaminopimelate decarboxylase [Nitrospirota bacterium]
MHDFQYIEDELYAEKVPLKKIAEAVGTPFYVYSENTLKNHFRAVDTAFSGIDHLICYAVKANPSLSILRIFAQEGSGADVVSGGELYTALKAGIDPKKIVFAGVGKTDDEIAFALKSGILLLNVESPAELERIDRIAGSLGMKAPVALRVNPDVDPVTHPYIATGLRKSKFGMDVRNALEAYQMAAGLAHVEVLGIHKHIGSQITSVRPFVEALEKLLQLVRQLRDSGTAIRYVDIGGGLGITYHHETPPQPKELGQAVVPMLRNLDCTLIWEPGRVLVGNAGILVTRVIHLKATAVKNFVIVDAGMNDLLRPSLYDAYHEVLPVKKNGKGLIEADIVGPICESGDFLAKDRKIVPPHSGDLLAVMSAGAYGFAMASNYNSRPRAAEVLVRGEEFFVIRRREDYEDLLKGEEIPAHLN